jgi:hypothetical protein
MRRSAPSCHLGLGKLYRRTRQRDQAVRHLTTAMTMYREMGMEYWVQKAEVTEFPNRYCQRRDDSSMGRVESSKHRQAE